MWCDINGNISICYSFIKTFTQDSVWTNHWKADSYPEQFLFSIQEHLSWLYGYSALQGREVRTSPICQAGRVVEGLQTRASNNPINTLGQQELSTQVNADSRERKNSSDKTMTSSHSFSQSLLTAATQHSSLGSPDRSRAGRGTQVVLLPTTVW